MGQARRDLAMLPPSSHDGGRAFSVFWVLTRMSHEVMQHSPVRADLVGVSRDEVAPPEADGYFGNPDRQVREKSGLIC